MVEYLSLIVLVLMCWIVVQAVTTHRSFKAHAEMLRMLASRIDEEAELPRVEALELAIGDLDTRQTATHASHKRLLARVGMREAREKKESNPPLPDDDRHLLDADPADRIALSRLLVKR